MNVPPFCLSANHRRLHCSSDSCLSSYPPRDFSFFFFFLFSFTITAGITNSSSSPSKTVASTAVNSSFLSSSQAQKNQPPPGHHHHHHHRQHPSDLTEATSSSAPLNRLNRQAQTSGANTHTRKESSNTASTTQSQRCLLRPPAVRLANPVNHVPRITPVAVPHPWQLSDEAQRDAYPLLTISERRRSQLPSPSSLVAEHSQGEIESWRTSIAVPPGQRSSFRGSHEHDKDDVVAPEMAAAAATTTTTVEGAAADNLRPPEQAYLGQNAGPADFQQPRHVSSQVSLRSQSQIASIPSNTGQQQPDIAEELAWGPAHPCFPHVNPHVPIGSQEYVTTRIIRIRRDWMVKGDLAPTFSNLYPEILDPLLSEQEFRTIVATVNDELIKAFDPFRFQNWIDGALGLVTGWLWEDLGASAIKRHLQRVEAWIENWNREVGAKDGVHIWSLRRTAYMSLDIQIPDPKVGIISNEDPSLPGTRPSTGFGGR